MIKLNAVSIMALLIILPNANGSNADAFLTSVVTVAMAILVLKTRFCSLFIDLGRNSYFIYFFHFHLLLYIERFFLTRSYNANSISLILLLPFLAMTILFFSFFVSKLSMALFEIPTKKMIYKLLGIKS